MNLLQLLKIIDEEISDLNSRELRQIIHEIARNIPKDKRIWLVGIINEIIKKESGEDLDLEITTLAVENLFAKRDHLLERFKAITKGEYVIVEEFNEEFDYWNTPDEDEFYYVPDDFIVETVKDSERLILELIDAGLYKEALDFLNELIVVDFYFKDASVDIDETLDYRDLSGYGIDLMPPEELALPIIYAIYKSQLPEKWMSLIEKTIYYFGYYDFKIEDLFAFKEELPDQDQILDLAIEYFGQSSGEMERQILFEAVDLVGDFDFALQKAKEFSKVHPAFYLDLLQTYYLNDKEIIEIGLKGLYNIDSGLAIRSPIAFWLSSAAIDENRPDLVDEGLYQAFLAKKTPQNYLRALYFSSEPQRMKERLSIEIGKGFERKSSSVSNKELAIYNPTEKEQMCLKILDGQFEQACSEAVNTKYFLGWTGSGIKETLALTLIALNRNGIELPDEIEEIAKIALCPTNHDFGIESFRDLETDLFYEDAFKLWKALIPEIDRDTALELIQKFEKLMESRTDAIMEKNRTNYYGECAAFIVAIGLIKESLG